MQRILLVDDHVLFRKGVAALLAKPRGYGSGGGSRRWPGSGCSGA